MKTWIKKRFPLIVEVWHVINKHTDEKKYKARVKAFYSMSKEELLEYNAKLYEEKVLFPLNYNNLKTYTEKMQWAKIFDLDERKVLCSDKYAVRNWVAERIGEEYLIPLLGVWKEYSEINFSELPNQFVLKTNKGSGDVCIVRDKKNLKLSEKLRIKRIINSSMLVDYSINLCEMHYSKIEPRIIAESFIDSGDTDLPDYKFLCFNGIPFFVWIDIGRYTNHKRNVYDMNWNLQSWNQRNYGNTETVIPKPKNFEKMVEIVKILSKGFHHVRVDLYNVNGKIYFGEMTFTNGSGFEPIIPREADKMLGDLWELQLKS